MDGQRFWEQEYESLMETARKNLDPNWVYGEAVVLKTTKGNLYVARIPNYQKAELREPLENQCIQEMVDAEDAEVFSCLATVSGNVPEMLSWNFRSRLIEVNSGNLRAQCFLWGGGENIHLRSFRSLL